MHKARRTHCRLDQRMAQHLPHAAGGHVLFYDQQISGSPDAMEKLVGEVVNRQFGDQPDIGVQPGLTNRQRSQNRPKALRRRLWGQNRALCGAKRHRVRASARRAVRRHQDEDTLGGSPLLTDGSSVQSESKAGT